MIITIDGPAGTGKSTVALQVAKKLGYLHLDTGAFYRAITYAAMSQGIDTENQSAMEQFAVQNPTSVQFQNGIPRYFVQGQDTTDFIRSREVTQRVSKVSSYPLVRQALIRVQREFAQGINVVCEGRDMGTNVFPNAQVKIFLTASPEVRADRRYKEIAEKGPLPSDVTYETILEDIIKRDHMDSTRAVNPLQVPERAHIIDTSDMSREEVIDAVLALANEFLKK